MSTKQSILMKLSESEALPFQCGLDKDYRLIVDLHVMWLESVLIFIADVNRMFSL